MRVGSNIAKDGRITVAEAERAAAHHGDGRGPERHVADGAPKEPSPFARVLHGLGHELDRGERMVRRAIGGAGRDLGPGELLALQAGVYRYSEAVDLSAKLVDRATSGVKTVLQGQ